MPRSLSPEPPKALPETAQGARSHTKASRSASFTRWRMSTLVARRRPRLGDVPIPARERLTQPVLGLNARLTLANRNTWDKISHSFATILR